MKKVLSKEILFSSYKSRDNSQRNLSHSVFKGVLRFFLILFFISLPCRIYSQDDILSLLGEQEIKLYLGETKVFSAHKPRSIVIGNPEVADVVTATNSAITLASRGVGVTNFIFKDIFGEHAYRIKVMTEDISDIKKRVDALLKELKLARVYTKANEEEGVVLLLGKVKTEEEKNRVELVLGKLKEKTVDLIEIKNASMVEIEVRVLELNRDAEKTLGFSWPAAITGTESSLATTEAVSHLKEFFHVSDWTRTNFSTTLDMLVQEGKARVLSQPRLACLSGKEAELLVGGEKPTFTTSVASATGGSSTSVDYKEYGIKLKILPTVKNNNKIHISLNVDVSEIGTAEIIGSSEEPTAKAYPVSKRDITTEVYLKDGQVLAIGGLIKQKDEEDVSKIPLLGDIPLLGALFRNKSVKRGGGQGERGEMELFITLTPKIIVDADEKWEEVPLESSETIKDSTLMRLFKDYIRMIQERVVNSAYYPSDAQESDWEGTVRLSILLVSDGRLKEVKILESSGYGILDKAALEAVNKQAPYPSFPKHIKHKELEVEIPITYRKND